MSRTETAWERLSALIAEDRLAHAYIIQGHAKREGRAFVQRISRALFPGAESRVDDGIHPDILSIEPQSKSRTILVRQVEAVIGRLQQKAFEGGWKLAVIYDAERMAPAGANKLLKTLEEPPGRSLILLVTETPKAMLDTIISRCQTIALDPMHDGDAVWRAPLINMLGHGVPRSPLEATRQAAAIKGLLDAVKAEVTEEVSAAEKESAEALDKAVIEARVAARVKATTREILVALQAWHRDLLLAAVGTPPERFAHPEQAERLLEIGAGLGYERALKRLQKIEKVARRMEFVPNMQALLESALR